jgi:hypothetical protein
MPKKEAGTMMRSAFKTVNFRRDFLMVELPEGNKEL